MKTTIIIPTELAALIPCGQLAVTKRNPRAFKASLDRLAVALELCPPIGATDGAEEHPCLFHYFYGGTDIFICEYDRKDLMFGYTILNRDLHNTEWGYTSLKEITGIHQFDIDYHFPAQTIEAALYKAYPDHYKKPQSLNV